MYRGKPSRDQGPKRNHQIRAKTVRLIDQDGENHGEVDIRQAMSLAQEAEMDLIEVGADANPPVVKIMDYSKYLYELKKKLRKNKANSKTKSMKEFKFTPVIEEHDTNLRVRRAKEYLEKGHNVRLTMYRKGRQSKELAADKFTEILTQFTEYSSIETKPKLEGRRMFVTLKPN